MVNGSVVIEKLDLINLGTNSRTNRVDDEEGINIAGHWKVNFTGLLLSIAPVLDYPMYIEQDESNLSATLMNGDYSGTIIDNEIELTRKNSRLFASIGGVESMSGTVNDDATKITGTWKSGPDSGSWTAVPGVVPEPEPIT